MEITKVLVTGSEGYIGSVLVNKLMKQGYKVTGLDTCFYINDHKKRRYRLIKNDIRNINNLNLSPFDAIVHLAALSNDPMGEMNPKLTEEINFQATLNLAKKAKQQKVKRFLFSSSCSIYGIAKKETVNERFPTNPLTAYAKSKIKSEKELIKLANNNFCVGILRNSTVYGYSPQFRDDLVVNNLVCCALATGEIRIMSDGTPWRPLIDVADLSDIFIRFLTADTKKINGQIINIGFKENNFQVKEIVNKIKNFLPDCQIVYTGEHDKDSRSYKVDFTKFNRLFPHVTQKVPITQSIKNIIKQLKKCHYNQYAFKNKSYSRLKQLRLLTDTGKLDTNLYWN